MSASIVAAVSVVPSEVIPPVTSGVRPTPVVDPIPVNSSPTRNPTNVPFEFSQENVRTEVSADNEPLAVAVVGGFDRCGPGRLASTAWQDDRGRWRR
jgi:hypothetical protein